MEGTWRGHGGIRSSLRRLEQGHAVPPSGRPEPELWGVGSPAVGAHDRAHSDANEPCVGGEGLATNVGPVVAAEQAGQLSAAGDAQRGHHVCVRASGPGHKEAGGKVAGHLAFSVHRHDLTSWTGQTGSGDCCCGATRARAPQGTRACCNTAVQRHQTHGKSESANAGTFYWGCAARLTCCCRRDSYVL